MANVPTTKKVVSFFAGGHYDPQNPLSLRPYSGCQNPDTTMYVYNTLARHRRRVEIYSGRLMMHS